MHCLFTSYFIRTIIEDLINNNLAGLDPKPNLYTLFTYWAPPPGQSYTAGVAWMGSVCNGKLKELYGDNLDDWAKQESKRSSINIYANFASDLDVAEVCY